MVITDFGKYGLHQVQCCITMSYQEAQDRRCYVEFGPITSTSRLPAYRRPEPHTRLARFTRISSACKPRPRLRSFDRLRRFSPSGPVIDPRSRFRSLPDLPFHRDRFSGHCRGAAGHPDCRPAGRNADFTHRRRTPFGRHPTPLRSPSPACLHSRRLTRLNRPPGASLHTRILARLDPAQTRPG